MALSFSDQGHKGHRPCKQPQWVAGGMSHISPVTSAPLHIVLSLPWWPWLCWPGLSLSVPVLIVLLHALPPRREEKK